MVRDPSHFRDHVHRERLDLRAPPPLQIFNLCCRNNAQSQHTRQASLRNIAGANLILHNCILVVAYTTTPSERSLHSRIVTSQNFNKSDFVQNTTTTNQKLHTSTANAGSLHTRYQYPNNVRREPVPVGEGDRSRSRAGEPGKRGAAAQASAGEESGGGQQVRAKEPRSRKWDGRVPRAAMIEECSVSWL